MGQATGWREEPARSGWAWRCAPAPGAAIETLGLGDVTLFRLSAIAAGPLGAVACTPPRGAVLLVTLTRGACVFSAPDGRPHKLRRRDVLLALGGAPLALTPEPGARLAALAAPAHLFSPRFISRERLQGGALAAHAGAVAAVLHDLVTRLAGGEASATGGGALIDAVGGLLSAMLEDSGQSAAPVRGGAALARREQIALHLRRHFADPELTAADVAGAIGVSRRYLHRLYAEAGGSFREDLIALRIEACLAALADVRQAGKTIAEIAYAAGYADISQFNRHFRRLHGATPSALRRAAQGAAAEGDAGFERRALTAA